VRFKVLRLHFYCWPGIWDSRSLCQSVLDSKPLTDCEGMSPCVVQWSIVQYIAGLYMDRENRGPPITSDTFFRSDNGHDLSPVQGSLSQSINADIYRFIWLSQH
jgi:hypothetical protein